MDAIRALSYSNSGSFISAKEDRTMMAPSVFKFGAAGVFLLGLGVSLALASADDAIKGRQNCMKNGHGKMVSMLVPILKGEQAYDPKTVEAAIAVNEQACADWDKWWGADTQKGETVETWAKAEIWSDPKGFEDAGGNFYNKYLALKATTDEAAFKAAFAEMGNACKGCHEKFRRPKDQ
jgi:cytochrome c556